MGERYLDLSVSGRNSYLDVGREARDNSFRIDGASGLEKGATSKDVSGPSESLSLRLGVGKYALNQGRIGPKLNNPEPKRE